ncbi:MAG: acyltransferase [Bacteroidota bacterium]
MYFKQLDFLRFVAVSLVIIEHWYSPVASDQFMLGRLGVSLFFTLSGFLITNILLGNKENYLEGKATKSSIFKTFYIRRTLRIFPIYYLLLIILYVFSLQGIREKIGWYALYSSNIYIYLHQKWDGMIGPLWSLAVEEQFYLIWPFLILTIPKKHILRFFVICVLAAPVLRIISVYCAEKYFQSSIPMLSMVVLTPTCLDMFAIGGILAYVLRNKEQHAYLNSLFKNSWITLSLAIISFVMLLFKNNYFFYALFPTVFSCFSAMLINRMVIGIKGWGQHIFENRFFLHLGRISYGLYLYHGPLPLLLGLLDFSLSKLHLNISVYESLQTLPHVWKISVWVVYLIIIATLSYYLIEKPFNNLKKKFSYTSK